MPSRIQRRRTAGWKMPEGAIYVGRGSKWGNPFMIAAAADAEYSNSRRACVSHYTAWIEGHDAYCDTYDVTPFTYDRRWVLANLSALRGHDLACWCRLDQPCHADVLLALANGEI